MPNITPCLWFDDQAEEAAKFYTKIFPKSRVLSVSHYGEGAPLPAGTVLTVEFTLGGQTFTALNGGPQFTFNEAVSFQVPCKDQKEVDRYWDALLAKGGTPSQCGWLKDRFGVSWQVFPAKLGKMLTDKDAARARRVFAALMPMGKIDVAALEEAYGRNGHGGGRRRATATKRTGPKRRGR